MLKATAISKSYNSHIVLDNVSIEIEPGSACVIIGPSGAGKTTLLRCLGMLDKPDSGTISIDDRLYTFPTVEEEFKNPWPELTMVFQQHFLWPHLTLIDNITLPLEGRCSQKDIQTILEELVDLFDMSEFIHRYPNEASLGQRQRVALARALALQPRYILLDEVTSSLDVEQIENLFGHLMELLKRGIGVLIITHLIGFARAVLKHSSKSNIVFLDEGRAAASGGLDLLESPTNGRISEFLAKMQLAT